ncbi:MAG: class II fructose-bisphosphate aldolase [Chloroflexota bacterium]
MLVPMSDLLAAADRDGYCVGSFDVVDMETCRAVLDVAVELRSPVIIAIPEHFGELCGFANLVKAVNDLSAPLDIPVATILDHGRTYESCMRALRAGMTAVMFDGSTQSLADNIAITRSVVQAAHAMGVTVEGEVGHVGKGDQSAEEALDTGWYTDPEQAVEFVEKTGVDALAVAVGTAHGLYKGTPQIDYDLLRRLNAAVPVPLVLHGGSSTGDERLRMAVEGGIRKINIFTDMSVQAMQNMREVMEREGRKAHLLKVLLAARQGFTDISAHYMHLFGSVGHA